MHISIDTKQLKDALDVVSRVSVKHLTLPILQCVLLEAKNNTLFIKATNLEIGIEGTLQAIIEEEGSIAVPAQIFVQTVNLITQKNISLITKDNVLHIDAHTSKTEIKSIHTTDFPHIPKITGTSINIQSSLFVFGIKTTAFAASQSSIKPELGSIYIYQKKEHSLTFVTTDSFRLIEKTIPQKNIVLSEPILIPYKNALELARVAESISEDIQLNINENQCALTAGNIYITSRLINGTFPDYEQIIPKEYKTQITILTSDLIQALKKTNIFLNKFMQLTITIGNNECILSAQNNDAGTTRESFKASKSGEDITLNFNQRYIQEITNHITDDSIILKCAGIGRPMILEGIHDKTLRYLVMPMNK